MELSRTIRHVKTALAGLMVIVILFGLTPLIAFAQSKEDSAPQKEAADASEHGDLGEVGAKLANPLGSLWSLVMNFETPKFFDGNISTGNPQIGADMIFQPVLPIPLYGRGKEQWRLITRPVIPFIFS
jgi:hypothetical protein